MTIDNAKPIDFDNLTDAQLASKAADLVMDVISGHMFLGTAASKMNALLNNAKARRIAQVNLRKQLSGEK